MIDFVNDILDFSHFMIHIYKSGYQLNGMYFRCKRLNSYIYKAGVDVI